MLNNILKNKWIYRAVLVTVITLIAGFMFVIKPGIEHVNEIEVDRGAQVTENSAGNETLENASAGLYYVQEAEGTVNIYKYEENEKVFYQATNIAFDLLSDEDQALLKAGIQLKDEQELADFLENFDS